MFAIFKIKYSTIKKKPYLKSYLISETKLKIKWKKYYLFI